MLEENKLNKDDTLLKSSFYTLNFHLHAHLRADFLQCPYEAFAGLSLSLGEDDDPVGQGEGGELSSALHLSSPLGISSLVRRKLRLHDDLLRRQHSALEMWRRGREKR